MNNPNMRIVFRHMESTENLEVHINKQMEKVVDFLQKEKGPYSIDLVMNPSKLRAHHEVDLLIKTPDYHVVVKKEGADFYLLLDEVIDIAYRKLHEEKREKIDDRKQERPDKRAMEGGEYRHSDKHKKRDE